VSYLCLVLLHVKRVAELSAYAGNALFVLSFAVLREMAFHLPFHLFNGINDKSVILLLIKEVVYAMPKDW
jgi:hypothetical protein